jgi:hypothetical protein
MKRLVSVSVISFFSLFSLIPDISASVIYMTKEELIQKFTDVIHGIVKEVKCEWNENHTMIYTYTKLEVLHVFKGEPRDEIVIQTFGGTIGDTCLWMSDQPELKVGMEVIIHVMVEENGNYGIRGLDQGVYYVNDGIISNPSGDLNMTLDQFKNFVDDVMRKSEFNFIFKYGVGAKNELNTFENTFTKDMICDPDTTVNLSLSNKEMKKIYKKMTKIGFFDYPDTFSINIMDHEIVGDMEPHCSYFFKVEHNSEIKELWWVDNILLIKRIDVKAEKLKELIMFIKNIIESKEEYKKLPPPRGGYI